MRALAVLPLLFAVACGGDSGNNTIDAPIDVSMPDASGDGSNMPDGPPSGNTIKISGKASLLALDGTTDLSGVVVAAYANTDEANPVATATTGGGGSYTLMIPAGVPLDGFLKATRTGSPDTYLYPPTPLATDFDQASINMVDSTVYTVLKNSGGLTADEGMIVLIVFESITATAPVQEAVVTSTPSPASDAPVNGETAYSGTFGIPSFDLPSTQADGRAFLFGYQPGTVTVSATKTGLTFKPTTLKVHADAFTTTIITQ